MAKTASKTSLFDMLTAGLEDSIAYSRGKNPQLLTTRMPAPPPAMSATRIVQVRRRLNMTQDLFAAALNVSTKTVQSWEQGQRTPGSASLRLLQIALEYPRTVWAVATGDSLESTGHGKQRRPGKKPAR